MEKSKCHHPKEQLIKNKIGMIGCLMCNCWLTPPRQKNNMLHNFLVKKSASWLRSHTNNIKVPNCSVVVTELVCATPTGEIPDVIGFSNKGSVLIEVKVSRSDFLRDKNKVFRLVPEIGLGEQRFFCCPENIIDKKEVPENWGLLYSNEKGKIRLVKFPNKQPSSLKGERAVLLSIIRRNKIKP